jgi:hypothetical protein
MITINFFNKNVPQKVNGINNKNLEQLIEKTNNTTVIVAFLPLNQEK